MKSTRGPPAPPEDPKKPFKSLGIDPRKAPDRWISIGGIIFKPIPAVGDHPGVLPVSLRLRPKISSVVLLNSSPPSIWTSCHGGTTASRILLPDTARCRVCGRLRRLTMNGTFLKQYRCLRNKRPSKPYEIRWLGAMDVTKPYKFISASWPAPAGQSTTHRRSPVSPGPSQNWDHVAEQRPEKCGVSRSMFSRCL